MSHGAAHGARPAFPPATRSDGEASVLVLFCHPAVHRSRVNRALRAAIDDLPGVTVHDLYEAWPDFGIDVAAEQALLARHDAVVFQHPLYWYSSPALLKEWQDLVLTLGWAYGPGGTALRGKRWLTAVTTGAPEVAYTADGLHGVDLATLLMPFRATARLCGMTWIPPFVTHGTHRLDDVGIVAAARDYRAVITALRDGTLRAAATPDGRLDVARALGGEGAA